MRVRFENDDRVGLSTDAGDFTVTIREWDDQMEVDIHFTEKNVEELPRISVSDARGNTYDWDNPAFVH